MTVAATDWYAPSAIAPVVRRHARFAHRTVGTFLWVIVFLLAAEAALRVRAVYRHGSGAPVADIYEPDTTLGRRLRAGAKLDGRDRHVAINSLGFRGPEIPRVKPPGTMRIAAIGDSTTFGMEASRDGDVWVERMAARLNDASTGARYDAINGGVPGYTLAVSAEQLSRYIAPLNPDIVIVNQVTTDIAAHSRRQFRGESNVSTTPSAVPRFLDEHSVLVNVLRQNTVAFTAKCIPQRRHDRLDGRGVAEYADRLSDLVRSCRDRGWRVILCTCPRSFGDESAGADQYTLAATALANNPALSLAGLNDAFDRYNAAIRQVARTLDVPFVDLDRSVPRSGDYFVDAVHLNDTGHDFVGALIAAVVLDDVAQPPPAGQARQATVPQGVSGS